MSTSMIDQRTVKTRKVHRCRVCYERIEKGSRCPMYKGVDGDGFFTLHFHDDCFKLSSQWDDWDWEQHEPGNLSRKEVREALNEHVSD